MYRKLKSRSLRRVARLFVLFCLITLASCEKESLPPSIVSFSPVNGPTGTSVTIEGQNFSPTTTSNIVKFNQTVAVVTSSTSESIIVTVPNGASTGKISVTVKDMTATSVNDFTVFFSPEISSMQPLIGFPGESITINGENFSTVPSENLVSINGVNSIVTASTETTLTVTVPDGITSGNVAITVNGLTTTSTEVFVVPPVITEFSPLLGTTGTSVTISGSGFHSVSANNIVRFNDKVASVNASTYTSLTVIVPNNAETGEITVTVSGATDTSSVAFTVIPVISSLSTSKGTYGSTVVINGTGFSATTSLNTVKFNGSTAPCVSATNTSLTVLVPQDATSGKVTVEVGDQIATSEADFEVIIEAIKAGGTSWDQSFAVAVDGDRNTFIAGRFSGTSSFGNTNLTSKGSDDIFIAKYDPKCDLVWVKQFGGTYSDECRSIAVDEEGNIFMTGSFCDDVSFGTTDLSAQGSSDIFVVKINTSGDVLWAKQIGSSARNFEFGWDLKVDALDNLYLTGAFFSSITVGTTTLTSGGESDILVAKLNANTGDFIWAKGFGGTSSDSGSALDYDSEGNVYVAGSFFGITTIGDNELTADGLDSYILKLNFLGSVVWVKQINGSGWENTYSMDIDENDNCYIAGYFSGTTTIGTTILNSNGQEDIFLVKFNSSGDVVWARNAGGNSIDQASSVVIDTEGNVYMTGYFESSATFGSISFTTEDYSRDIFVTKYNSSGDLLWAKKAGGENNDYGEGIAVDSFGTIYVVGSFTETVTFGTTELSSSGGDDIFLWKILQ